ncbi:MAG: hypothetical protein OEM67_03375 [Thermoleophilia bacterium]|nr:hypothetical protein [Thermoleophilia bacterium]
MNDPDEIEFRTIAAPGLEEDDVFAAMYGMPGEGALWGEGMPDSFPRTEPEWSAERVRHNRHHELLRKWPPVDDVPGDDGEESPQDRLKG